jgi:serine/threonine-protein phosphatase PGAM5
MAKRHIYLLRHGQREAGEAPDDFGPSLTSLGWKQARHAARRLSAYKVDVIYTSSLRRAMETAKIVALEHPNIPIRPSDLLWECIPAVPEHVIAWFKAHPKMDNARIPPEIVPWANIWSEEMDAEAMNGDFAQAQAAWDRYFAPMRGKERHEIIVCHGNLIRYFVMRALQAPPENWINTDIYNCAISEIVIESTGRVMLISHNDSGHLPPGMLTFT